MKVCVDIQSAVAQRAGVGRYTKCLAEALAIYKARDDELMLAYLDFKRHGAPFQAPGAQFKAVRLCPGRVAQYCWKTFNWPPYNWLTGNSADVYHFPNFIIPPLAHGRSVVTVHDVSFLRHPEFAEARNLAYLKAKIRQTVTRADAILTDSQFSANEIIELLGVAPERVYAIPLGITPPPPRPTPARIRALLKTLGLERPYLLAVGTIEPRKNLAFLVDVFEAMKDFDGDLAVVGMPGWQTGPILERMHTSSKARRILQLGYQPDETLEALYANARALVFPSLYEGFGLPPLEAMARGTPVVASGIEVLREVLGTSALMMNGFDANEWATAISALLRDEGARTRLSAEGRQQAARFTWEVTARKTWEIYRQVGIQ